MAFTRPLPPTLVRRIAWWLIACMALASLHSALAATWVLAQGGSAGGAEMIEVCTNQGVRWVSLQTAQSDPTQATETGSHGPADADPAAVGADGTPHCPLCRFVGDAAPDLSRRDLRFAAPLHFQAPPPEKAPALNPAACVVLTAPPRAPPSALF